MIYLKKGQSFFEDIGVVVCDPTGYYDDGSSVLCAPYFNPEEPSCRYEAKFIAYGPIVYNISDPEELLKQVMEIDPNTLFGKDSKEIALNKVVDEIVVQDTTEPPIAETPATPPAEEPVVPPVETPTETPVEEPVVPPVETPTETPSENNVSNLTAQ